MGCTFHSQLAGGHVWTDGRAKDDLLLNGSKLLWQAAHTILGVFGDAEPQVHLQFGKNLTDRSSWGLSRGAISTKWSYIEKQLKWFSG